MLPLRLPPVYLWDSRPAARWKVFSALISFRLRRWCPGFLKTFHGAAFHPVRWASRYLRQRDHRRWTPLYDRRFQLEQLSISLARLVAGKCPERSRLDPFSRSSLRSLTPVARFQGITGSRVALFWIEPRLPL